MNTLKKLMMFCLLLLAGNVFAQPEGKVIEEQNIKSDILKHNVKYAIYLPADYETSNRSYPVVYLLHGYGDDHTGWLQFGEINRYADKAIAEGKIPPMIIVMPDAQTTFYINSYDGKLKYEDFFFKEFIPAIEGEYRVKTSKQYRAVAGLSMGGFGTLVYSLKHPEMFSAAAALSAAVRADDDLIAIPDARWAEAYSKVFGPNLKGSERLNATWRSNAILGLVQSKSADELKSVRYWIDCGDDDALSKGNSLLHIALTEKKVPHEFRIRDGAHNWTYWRSGITDALEFIGDSFRQK
ncbi:alpha/beta hydrolase [Mucilaginibacter pocheonensis]|uniref:Enterochelin esterase-like enzyme n=1 Tax=Mucilaginibacter pocheonensis TaxID=398050 RepID=A0ABU1TI49_9SPHI|nr:alpha/beta hydrolase-fold protein [Mucilaginibacter pocheonensis]MDR6944999.1 enterochelin esterase-like enzyme [Mucilaginibacter pocheonensis]